MSGALQHYLDLLQQFADGSLDVEEFSASYWSLRFRWRLDRVDVDGAAKREMQPFETVLLTYTPDLEPDVRLVEDRELRRRAARTRQALLGQAVDTRAEQLDEGAVAG